MNITDENETAAGYNTHEVEKSKLLLSGFDDQIALTELTKASCENVSR